MSTSSDVICPLELERESDKQMSRNMCCAPLLVFVAIVMLHSQSAWGASTTSEMAMAVWGSLPLNARVIRTDAEGIRHVELTENVPETLDMSRPFCHWLVWPMNNPKDSERFLRRSIHYTTEIVTPEGTFALGVKQGFEATSTDGKQEGCLAHLCFDPGKKSELKYPFPAVFKAATESGILSPIQEKILSSLNEVLKNRFVELKHNLKAFAQATYVNYSRTRFLEALASFYLLPTGMSGRTLDPAEFFDRGQRMRLREIGHQIRGRCLFVLDQNKLHILFKKCPLSQVVSDWNRVLAARAPAGGQKLPLLVVAAERQTVEIDGTVELHVSSAEEAEKLALGLLLGFQGISLSPP